MTIVPKDAGDVTNATMTRLDDYFPEGTMIDFLKLHVEAYDAQVLYGARKLVGPGNVSRRAVCANHNPRDEADLSKLLHSIGSETSISQGYPRKTCHRPICVAV